MKYVDLPESAANRHLPFYLAVEEYVARRFAAEPELFFMWQVDPTVICGRNQMIAAEVDLPYCREHGIEVWRRRSGGGAVYADRSNIMMSYVTTGTDIGSVFAGYTARMAAFLRSLGLDASDTSRNDVLIGSRKVSGNAFYRSGSRCIAHGTMLYNADPSRMAAVLTPSAAKLSANGVKSVPSRITTIREHSSISLHCFMAAARNYMCGAEAVSLSEADIQEVEAIEKQYLSDQWLWQHSPKGDFEKCMRFDGVGELQLSLTLSHGLIHNLFLTGDFFITGDIDASLLAPLRGVPYTPAAVDEALRNTDPASAVSGLTREMVSRLLF